MSKGYIAPTVPEAWTIYEDRLYLNFSLRALELWLQDVPAILPWGMRIGPSLSNKKRGPVALFIVSTFKLIIIPLDQFFCLRPEYRQGRAHPPRVLFSYSLMSRHMCYISCRCRCVLMCSYRNRRKLRLRSLAFWPWCVRPLSSKGPQQVLRRLRLLLL
jgi:hypothetical protein